MENNIVSFDIVRINRARDKICKCNPAHYEVDTTNRIVTCQDCGSIVNAFDALVSLAGRYEEIEKTQQRMLSKAQSYAKLADDIVNIGLHFILKNVRPYAASCSEA